mmetsp:Transcript_1914/g.4850  ORF Transcript_1914/g.4850 Transcript_1914/m.4850 type:complete len:81 (-) Transcript_1914:1951-2193(-)
MWHLLYVLACNTVLALIGRYILIKLGLWGDPKAEIEKEKKLKEEIRRYRAHQARQQEVLNAAKADLSQKRQQQAPGAQAS